jgi:YD repeat-containing protein
VTILNGLEEPIVTFDQGDGRSWVLNGWRETNASGQTTRLRRPWEYNGDPTALVWNASPIPIPTPDSSYFEASYDEFGRNTSVRDVEGLYSSKELLRKKYFPLAIETRDAEQLKIGGQHEKAFKRVEFDGRGHAVRATEHIENPSSHNIITSFEYGAVGEPSNVTRTYAGGTYKRTMTFDSLGRLVANREPNTGMNWLYAWDDAGRLIGTSDARGCGEDFYYDGLSRLLGEDYWPCLAWHPPHSAPNLITGEGLEVSYRYDTYESDQINPEPGFSDDPSFAIGHLVAVKDRGSHTRFSYDGRDRIRRIGRQIAKPGSAGDAVSYAPHWFTSRLDYDLGDRLTRRTTGADVPDLLMGGSSEERYSYSARGQISGIDSSYGAIVKSAVYNPDGAPTRIVYGDMRGTVATFGYDDFHRLALYQLIAPQGSFPLQIGHFDYRISSYDDVGNPLAIEDQRIPWQPLPPDAAPQEKRVMEYDDLYRVTRIDTSYKTHDGIAPWRSPFEAEQMSGDRHPVPLRTLPTRVSQQTFEYDDLGNIVGSSDDLSAPFDRSLGSGLGYGTPASGPNPANGPNQLRSASGLSAQYDEAGNLTELKVARGGTCPAGAVSQCAQWFVYDWDEVGQLARARRWDFEGNTIPAQPEGAAVPTGSPSWDLAYAYSQGARVRKSVAGAPFQLPTSKEFGERAAELGRAYGKGERPLKSVAGELALAALKQAAWSAIDPFGVNRGFVNNVLTATTHNKASSAARWVAGAGAAIAVLPVIGEARGILGAAEAPNIVGCHTVSSTRCSCE